MSRANLSMRVVAFVGVLSSLVACTSVPVHLGHLRSVPHDTSNGREISGEACGFMLAGLIPITTHSRAERALGVLIQESRGDYIDGISVSERWRYAFVGTLLCTRFTATAYPTLPGVQ